MSNGWQACGQHVASLWQRCGKAVASLWQCRGNVVAKLWHRCGNLGDCVTCGNAVAMLWQSCGNVVASLWQACGRDVAQTKEAGTKCLVRQRSLTPAYVNMIMQKKTAQPNCRPFVNPIAVNVCLVVFALDVVAAAVVLLLLLLLLLLTVVMSPS